MQTFPNGTTLEAEEKAYNTFHGYHSRSGRRAKALCSDGKIRTFIIGIPDTAFTIPAHGRINGRYVSGFVSMEENGVIFTELPKSR